MSIIFERNILYIKNRDILFDYNIKKVIETNGVFIVLLDIPTKDNTMNNIYRTGDVASLLPGPCACGSPLKRLGPVLGRIARGPDGRAHIVQPEKGAARQVHRESL